MMEYKLGSNGFYNILYKITNLINNKIYIGVHRTKNPDDNYMGSGYRIKLAIEKYGIDNFKKEFLCFYDTEEEMYNAERAIVTDSFIQDNSNYNVVVGGKFRPITDELRQHCSLGNLGYISARDIDGNCVRVSKDDERWITHELVGSTTGFNTYLDPITKQKVRCSKYDERVLNGELVGLTMGRTLFKDVKTGELIYTSVDDPRVKSGMLVGHTAGSKQTVESNKKRSDKQKGIPKPKQYYECPYCHKKTIMININRWHKECKELYEKETGLRYSLGLKETSRC